MRVVKRLDSLPTGGRVDLDVLDEDDNAGLAIAGLLEAVGRLNALGRRVLGSVRVEAIGDAGAQRAGDDREDDGHDHDRPAAPVRQQCKPFEHQAALLVFFFGFDFVPVSSARARSHHSMTHAVDSSP